jgi:hypothetical protein
MPPHLGGGVQQNQQQQLYYFVYINNYLTPSQDHDFRRN